MRHQSQRLTYAELDERSNALAHGFQNLGVKKGDRVAVSLGNNIEFAIVLQDSSSWASYDLHKLDHICPLQIGCNPGL